jgi:hypothetical protein
MKLPPPDPDSSGSFTVTMSNVLRDPFIQWLKCNRLAMTEPGGDQVWNVWAVAPLDSGRQARR